MARGLPQLREQPGPGGLLGASWLFPPACLDSQRRPLGEKGPCIHLGPESWESLLTKPPGSAECVGGRAPGGLFGLVSGPIVCFSLLSRESVSCPMIQSESQLPSLPWGFWLVPLALGQESAMCKRQEQVGRLRPTELRERERQRDGVRPRKIFAWWRYFLKL